MKRKFAAEFGKLLLCFSQVWPLINSAFVTLCFWNIGACFYLKQAEEQKPIMFLKIAGNTEKKTFNHMH